MEDLTYEYVSSILNYDPNTGILTNKFNRGPRARAGQEAGCSVGGYRKVVLAGKPRYSHRIAWLLYYGELPVGSLDHINLNRSDNRMSNLREANCLQNSHNTGLLSTNTSGYRGVSFNKKAKKYVAQIRINGIRQYIGSYNTALEASTVYNELAKQTRGEFYKET